MPSKRRRIVWVSRHLPTDKQRAELKRLFSHSELVFDHRPFDTADDIVERFQELKGDELVIVAPMWIIRSLIRKNLHPIYSEMVRVPCDHPKAEIIIGEGRRKRCFTFKRFVRAVRLEWEVEEIKPT